MPYFGVATGGQPKRLRLAYFFSRKILKSQKMAYRFTDTEKWSDNWFSELSQIQMLLFIYLCDNCDIAGFIEVNYKRWASDLNSSKETIEAALVGLQRGLIFNENNDCIYIRNFLKHQKNYPLNEKNKAHLGILRRFEKYSQVFDIKSIDEFLKGASKGLQSPTGNGNGKSVLDKAKLFYEEQTELSKNDSKYKLFVSWLFGDNQFKRPLESVLKMDEQISFNQFDSLLKIHEEYNVKIRDILEEMENWLMKNPKAKNSTVLGTIRTFAKRANQNQKK